MDEKELFTFLAKRTKPTLLGLLRHAFEEMTAKQRRRVFGSLIEKAPPSRVDPKRLLNDIREFKTESMAGKYFGPVRKDARGWYETPDETDEWFERLGSFLEASSRLSDAGKPEHAVACFTILYELIDCDTMCEVVFAEEVGAWMIPGDTKRYVAAYLSSLAAVASPEEYAEVALPLIRVDRISDQFDKVRVSARRAATPAQKRHLDAELRKLGL